MAAGRTAAETAPLTVVCDFDGTVAAVDVQHVIFDRFAGHQWIPINEAWRRGEVTTAERARTQWGMVHASTQEIRALVEMIPLDPGFPCFARLAQERGWGLRIVSDGFDLYIAPILAAHGLSGLHYSANHLEPREGGWAISLRRTNPACCRLGNCKRLCVEDIRRPGGVVVFVGDGLSDACGAEAADIVFAKGLLAAHRAKKGQPLILFSDFGDVGRCLQERFPLGRPPEP